jgi:hypothetical protein
MLVTQERQVLALGCNEEVSGLFNTRCIRGCDLEDYTSWTTSAANNVFEHILDDGGAIVGAEIVGQYVMVWTETSLFLGQFIGDPSQTYRFDRVGHGCGLIAPGAVAVHGGTAYWMDRAGQFYAYAAGAEPIRIVCPISRDFLENFDPDYKQFTHAGTVTQYDEIWWFYRDSRDSSLTLGATRYLALNYKDGAWFRGQLLYSVTLDIEGMDAASSFGGVLRSAWIQGSQQSLVERHELIPAYGLPRSWPGWFLQSADQYIDDGKLRIMVKGVVPDFEAQNATVDLTLYMRDLPQSEVVTKGPYALAVSATKKDFRASGMLMAVRLSADGEVSVAGNRMRLGKLALDTVPMGER